MHARRATEKDVDAICRICADGWLDTYSGLLPEEQLDAADGWDGWWVAVDDAAAITDQQRAQGEAEQWVTVMEGNDKGIPFYEARGFRRHGTRPAYGEGESAPASVLLGRSLV
jgi:hypothetical protein